MPDWLVDLSIMEDNQQTLKLRERDDFSAMSVIAVKVARKTKTLVSSQCLHSQSIGFYFISSSVQTETGRTLQGDISKLRSLADVGSNDELRSSKRPFIAIN